MCTENRGALVAIIASVFSLEDDLIELEELLIFVELELLALFWDEEEAISLLLELNFTSELLLLALELETATLLEYADRCLFPYFFY